MWHGSGWRRYLAGMLVLAVVSTAIGADEAGPRLTPVGPGWAKSSINTVIFRHSSVASQGDTQYTAYYDGESRVVVAKRKLGETKWETQVTPYSGNTKDAHNTISIAVDSAGFLHLAWDHHNVDLNYVRSKTPGSLELTEKLKTDGVREKSVTYPEFYNLPDGDLLLTYRVGSSGNGDMILKRYSPKTGEWTTLQQTLVAGEGKQNAYSEWCVDAKGTIHVGWVWRRTPDVATNHDVCYARSTDGGKTWTDSQGKTLALPITAATCEVALRVPEKSDLINQTTITADDAGHPYIATFFKPEGQKITQLMVVYHDGQGWKTSQVGERKTALNLGGGGTKRLLMSRPVAVVDPGSNPRVHVIFRDVDRGDRISVATTTNIAEGKWNITDITQDSYGFWEPTYDPELWRREKVLNLFVQKTDQVDGGDGVVRKDGPEPTMVSILEWKP